MMSEVARLYYFRGRHHVPFLPAPWCVPHEHDYTVEVCCRGPFLDTDILDLVWAELQPAGEVADMDAAYGAENTTVEALSEMWLSEISRRVPSAYRVVVWEDRARWGAATR